MHHRLLDHGEDGLAGSRFKPFTNEGARRPDCPHGMTPGRAVSNRSQTKVVPGISSDGCTEGLQVTWFKPFTNRKPGVWFQTVWFIYSLARERDSSVLNVKSHGTTHE